LGGEEEGGVGDLLSFSEEQGAAPNGDPRRQPWRFELVTGSVHMRKRERPRGEKGGRPGKERRRRGRRPGAAPRVLLVVQSGKQEVSMVASWEPPRTCLRLKTKGKFC
jgi:hypothetical protein